MGIQVLDTNITEPFAKVITCIANGATTLTYPVGIYYDNSGVLTCITSAIAVDDQPGKWGVPLTAVADGASVKVKVYGLLTLASGGTAGEVVTAIDATGVITDNAAADGNVSNNLATTISETTVLKVPMVD